jgi:CheY-like chemotaxis protein
MVPTEPTDRAVGPPAMIGGLTAPTPPVLVVDDDVAGTAATRATLAGGGYAVAAEAEGDAVLRLVRASFVGLVVSELYIPCAEGRCVVAALKGERRRLPRLRVLVHTRHTSPADLEWALGAGADAVVPKPVRTGILLREVGRLLDEVQVA